MKTLITLFLSMALAIAAAAEDGVELKVEIAKTIEVNKGSFSDIYPAVWLDPMRGTIHKLEKRSEDPPVEGALIWIEPKTESAGRKT